MDERSYRIEGVDVVWSPVMERDTNDWSDSLRALGHFLDEVASKDFEVAADGDTLVAAWSGPRSREQRSYGRSELEALRKTDRLYRGLTRIRPPSTAADGWRVIGSELNRIEARSFSVVESSTGYALHAVTVDGEVDQRYTHLQLRALPKGRAKTG